MTKKPSTKQVSADGIKAVVTALKKRGMNASVTKIGRKTYLLVSNESNSGTIQVKVKAKRKDGNWHSDIREGRAIEARKDDDGACWVFVHLNNYEISPTFWIVPDSWMRNDIFVDHNNYLKRYGGERKKTKSSTHHSIDEKRIAQWKNKWEMFDSPEIEHPNR